MLEITQLKEFATRDQTLELNITREYAQHVFLSYLYKLPNADQLLFKGGTALRVVFQSPRYSEDLDFSARTVDALPELLQKVASLVAAENMVMHITTSEPTSGGYIAKMRFEFPLITDNPEIMLNAQLKHHSLVSTATVIQYRYLPAYPIVYLHDEELVKEKIQAFRQRVKARDFFDLYFMLGNDQLRGYVTKHSKAVKRNMIDQLDRLENRELKGELRKFLPVNYHNLLSGDGFRSTLRKQIERYLPEM